MLPEMDLSLEVWINGETPDDGGDEAERTWTYLCHLDVELPYLEAKYAGLAPVFYVGCYPVRYTPDGYEDTDCTTTLYYGPLADCPFTRKAA